MLSSGPDVGLGLMTLRSRPEPKPRVGHLTRLCHPGASGEVFYMLLGPGTSSILDLESRLSLVESLYSSRIWPSLFVKPLSRLYYSSGRAKQGAHLD